MTYSVYIPYSTSKNMWMWTRKCYVSGQEKICFSIRFNKKEWRIIRARYLDDSNGSLLHTIKSRYLNQQYEPALLPQMK